MRRRLRPRPAVPLIEAIAVDAPARLVTLEDPNAAPTTARDAFARLRPPEGTSADAVAAWRVSVAAVALAVRVVPPPRPALVPLASTRVDAGVRAGSFRAEALALAKETGDAAVEALTLRLLDEAGA